MEQSQTVWRHTLACPQRLSNPLRSAPLTHPSPPPPPSLFRFTTSTPTSPRSQVMADKFIVIVDESKLCAGLGPGFPLPVEITPFCHLHTLALIGALPSVKVNRSSPTVCELSGNYSSALRFRSQGKHCLHMCTMQAPLRLGTRDTLRQRTRAGVANGGVSSISHPNRYSSDSHPSHHCMETVTTRVDELYCPRASRVCFDDAPHSRWFRPQQSKPAFTVCLPRNAGAGHGTGVQGAAAHG
jgi:hypothetical protein